jgi:hypothetical protein
MQNVMIYQNLKSETLLFDSNSHTPIIDSFLKVKQKIFTIYENQEKKNYEIDKDIKICEKYLQFILF